MVFEIQPIIDPGWDHQLSLLEREACYRFYVKMRRESCNYLEILDLWLKALYCEECYYGQPIAISGPPDISQPSWETDIEIELGEDVLEETIISLKSEDEDFCFICKNCEKELRPWDRDDIYVVTYHLEEHYGIDLETPGKINPNRKLAKIIFKLYDHKCFCCNKVDKNLHIDHILPRSKGGTAAFRNLQPLCSKCGQRKGNQVPEEIPITIDINFGGEPIAEHEELFW